MYRAALLLVGPALAAAQTVCVDCEGLEHFCDYVGDGYCDDGTAYNTNFNCAEYNFDEGDCDVTYDCDGREGVLLNKKGDGVCHNGKNSIINLDCVNFDYDGGDCLGPDDTPYDCNGKCLDTYPSDDGTCQSRLNCKKFQYSFQECYPPECPDGWYDMGRENYRCAQRTGGSRFASMAMDDFNECECYEYCQEQASEEEVELSAFDNYSGKCRCWTGECTDASTIACFDDGERAEEFDPDGRCPSATYFPHARVEDCHEGDFAQDVTMYQDYYDGNYKSDGFCDNAQFGGSDMSDYDWGDSPVGDFDCGTFEDDGGDCAAATCDERYEATQFATLGEPNMMCDGFAHGSLKEGEWTTACDCYSFCQTGSDAEVMFQHSVNNTCQCLPSCEYESNCGLESSCQVFSVEVVTDCCGNDLTLGIPTSELADTIGTEDFLELESQFLASPEAMQSSPKVLSVDTIGAYAESMQLCIPSFLCEAYNYSFGTEEEIEIKADGTTGSEPKSIRYSPCFECQIKTTEILEALTVDEERCDQAQGANRFGQIKDYYSQRSLDEDGRSPDNLDDYCTCESYCAFKIFDLAEQDLINNGFDGCLATNTWSYFLQLTNSDDFNAAIDAYKGDCRCWNTCLREELDACTSGAVNRCAQGPVSVTLLELDTVGVAEYLPPQRQPN